MCSVCDEFGRSGPGGCPACDESEEEVFIVHCYYCGDEFPEDDAELKRYKGKYCCCECYNNELEEEKERLEEEKEREEAASIAELISNNLTYRIINTHF